MDDIEAVPIIYVTSNLRGSPWFGTPAARVSLKLPSSRELEEMADVEAAYQQRSAGTDREAGS